MYLHYLLLIIIIINIKIFKLFRSFYSFRHLQRFWGASGDFWQAQWDKILDKLGDDPGTLWVYGKLK